MYIHFLDNNESVYVGPFASKEALDAHAARAQRVSPETSMFQGIVTEIPVDAVVFTEAEDRFQLFGEK